MVVEEATSAAEGVELITQQKPDLVLADIGLPDTDGLTMIRHLRTWTDVPIIVLSGRSQERLKVACLEAGADDYITKPFGLMELVARIRSVGRRLTRQASLESPVYESSNFRADMNTRQVWRFGKEVRLTPTEFKLLSQLIRRNGVVATHEDLLTEVWGDAYVDEPQYLRVYIGYLRKKLERDPNAPTLILTDARIGYRLNPEG
ncbi:MAG: Transcriptional regulatory protein KdpE [Fimbriimonadaceae bacterium]|nr:Transcriptional regulatory protein KdpE [Fimbriimonadaceae bacterium]